MLDHAAICLRTLAKNTQDISDDYMKNHKKLENIIFSGNDNIQKISYLEQKINNILEIRSSKITGFNLIPKLMKVPVKCVFLDKKINDLKRSLEELKKFHDNLLSHYGRYIGDLNEDSLAVKSGFMIQYFELSDLLLNTVSQVSINIKEYEKYYKTQGEYDQEIHKISNNIMTDLDKLRNSDDNFLLKIINDVQKFLDMNIPKCHEN